MNIINFIEGFGCGQECPVIYRNFSEMFFDNCWLFMAIIRKLISFAVSVQREREVAVSQRTLEESFIWFPLQRYEILEADCLFLSVSVSYCPYKSVYVCFCLFAVTGRCHTARLCISLPLAAELVAGSYAEHDELVFMAWQPPLECSHIYACRFSKLCHWHWFHNSINFWSWYLFWGELCWGVMLGSYNFSS